MNKYNPQIHLPISERPQATHHHSVALPQTIAEMKERTISFRSHKEGLSDGGIEDIFLLAVVLNPAHINDNEKVTRKFRVPVFVFAKYPRKIEHDEENDEDVFSDAPPAAFDVGDRIFIATPRLPVVDDRYLHHGYLLPAMLTDHEEKMFLRSIQANKQCEWINNGYGYFDSHRRDNFRTTQGSAKPAALTLMPRVHSPSGIYPRAAGYGFSLYTGMCCAAYLFDGGHITSESLRLFTSYIEGHCGDAASFREIGICSSTSAYSDGRSFDADVLWKKMIMREDADRNKYVFQSGVTSEKAVTIEYVEEVIESYPVEPTERGVTKEEKDALDYMLCDVYKWQSAQRFVIGLFDYNIANHGVCSTAASDAPIELPHPELILGMDVQGAHPSVINFFVHLLRKHIEDCQNRGKPCPIRESDVKAFKRYALGVRRNPSDDDVSLQEEQQFQRKRQRIVDALEKYGDLP